MKPYETLLVQFGINGYEVNNNFYPIEIFSGLFERNLDYNLNMIEHDRLIIDHLCKEEKQKISTELNVNISACYYRKGTN